LVFGVQYSDMMRSFAIAVAAADNWRSRVLCGERLSERGNIIQRSEARTGRMTGSGEAEVLKLSDINTCESELAA
jgi:hypothetical protein